MKTIKYINITDIYHIILKVLKIIILAFSHVSPKMYAMIIFIQHDQVQSLVAGPVLLPLLDSVPHSHHLRGQPEVALVGHLVQGGQGVMWSQDMCTSSGERSPW